MLYSRFTKPINWLKTKLVHRFGVRPLIETQEEIQSWFCSPVGQSLLLAEQKKLDRIMPEMYGYHLMQLSAANLSEDLARQSPVTHHFSLGVNNRSRAGAITEFENLPIDSDSIDVAVLHHVLEYSPKPHQLLREAARTIIPNGYIIIIGFNPWSVMTNKRQIGRLFRKNAQRRFHSMRRSRLVDWLQLLDFETACLEYGSHGLPIEHAFGRKLESLIANLIPVSGSFYMIVARKSIHSMTVIKPEWKRSPIMSAWVKSGSTQQMTQGNSNRSVKSGDSTAG